MNAETPTKRRRGRPAGIPREGKYGTGRQTKVVRVPVDIADNIENILKTFDQIKILADSWESKVEEAKDTSKHKGQIPARYDQAAKLLTELRLYLGE